MFKKGDKISEANAYCNLAVCYEAKGDLARSIEVRIV